MTKREPPGGRLSVDDWIEAGYAILADDGLPAFAHGHGDLHALCIAMLEEMVLDITQRRVGLYVAAVEDLPEFVGADFGAGGVGMLLHDTAELDLQAARLCESLSRTEISDALLREVTARPLSWPLFIIGT